MAITEEARITQEIEQDKNQISICEDAIQKAELYERLEENSDWKAWKELLRKASALHEQEIQQGIKALINAPGSTIVRATQGGDVIISSRDDWQEFITRHEIMRSNLEEWLKEPGLMIGLARKAREVLPGLKERLIKHESGLPARVEPVKVPASENGKL